MPRISICLPVLNAEPYLAERIETIQRQTSSDWEVIALDGFSTDGSWERLQQWAAAEARVRLHREPPGGIYAALNRCIEISSGVFVYLATADDTMAPDCLEKLQAALEAQAGCEIAHCSLRAFGESEAGAATTDWWRTRAPVAVSSGPLFARMHLRRAPFDGFLHYSLETVYSSLTQLLIRRSLFDKIGFFESRFASFGDFEWNCRAAFAANVVHVPDTWGGWRIHERQATPQTEIGTAAHKAKLKEMFDAAFARARPNLDPVILRRFEVRCVSFIEAREEYARSRDSSSSGLRKARGVLQASQRSSRFLIEWVRQHLHLESAWRCNRTELVAAWCREEGAYSPIRRGDTPVA